MREQADATAAEYVMSRLSPVPAAELATKDDARAAGADIGRVEGEVDALGGRVDERFDRLVELREAGLQRRAAEREADLKAHAAERKAAGRREWMFAHALAVEVAVVLAVAVAILEWLRG
ncbi:MAG: hypothetical protein OXB99_05145 [Acidimicrobiaceae bacterium]|nr:hypothetical protein [Acidimicrobiaceae bacterium]